MNSHFMNGFADELVKTGASSSTSKALGDNLMAPSFSVDKPKAKAPRSVVTVGKARAIPRPKAKPPQSNVTVGKARAIPRPKSQAASPVSFNMEAEANRRSNFRVAPPTPAAKSTPTMTMKQRRDQLFRRQRPSRQAVGGGMTMAQRRDQLFLQGRKGSIDNQLRRRRDELFRGRSKAPGLKRSSNLLAAK